MGSSEHAKLVDEAQDNIHVNLPVLKDNKGSRIKDNKGSRIDLVTVIGLLFLTLNSGMAVYQSNGDLGAICFVGFSYVNLLSLFYCLRLYERTAPDSPQREHLKMAVWLLTTLLTAAFSYKVAAIMPFPVQVLVWSLAGMTVLGGFYAFFLHREETKA